MRNKISVSDEMHEALSVRGWEVRQNGYSKRYYFFKIKNEEVVAKEGDATWQKDLQEIFNEQRMKRCL